VKASRDDRDEFRLGVDRMMTDKLTPAALHSLFDMEYHPIMVENEFTGELTRTQDLYVISKLSDRFYMTVNNFLVVLRYVAAVFAVIFSPTCPKAKFRKKILFIQTNSFIIFTCPRIQANGLARRLSLSSL
jgi:hypothetical protein